jgi:glycosyltransferase involved in cell wall biosynthesis
MRFVDTVVLVDEMQQEEFHGIPNDNVIIMYDTPFPVSRGKQFFHNSSFKIFYAGRIGKGRYLNLDSMMKAVANIDGVELIFAGTGDTELINEIKLASKAMPTKILYIGWIPYERVLQLSLETDLLFSLRDPNPPNQKYICGSKFLEATMCGKPILVNKGTSAAMKVTRNSCGVVVDAHNIQEISCVVSDLKNNHELCKELGNNGKIAYKERYSWDLMKERLLNLYDYL